MVKKRAFTEEELKELGMRTMDVALEAVEAGDKEKAKKLINRMNRDSLVMHDLYMNWIADLMDFIYVKDGEDALYQALRKAVGTYITPQADIYDKVDVRRKVRRLVSGLRGHLQSLEIEEDDEKVTLKMKPCGSGQRLLESGAYESPRNLSRLKAHRMTWGLPNFPIYCAHSPVQEILTIEKIGYPAFFCIPAKEMATDTCRFVIYKNPESIPEEIYKRVGFKKPG